MTVPTKGFVAVGYRDRAGDRDGLAWFSKDGTTWAPVGGNGTFDGVEMLDVTSVPGWFVPRGIATVN